METPIYLEPNIKQKMQGLVRNMGSTAIHYLSEPERPEIGAPPANITYLEHEPEDICA